MEAFIDRLFPSRRYRLYWVLLALFFAYGLFNRSLWSSNDAREGAMIREMVREKVWTTPVFNGKAYLEKPPLLHWTGAILCRAAGRVNEGLIRMPAAVFALGALWIIGFWARELKRELAGIFAALMCATSLLYFEYSRIVLTDAALTFMVVLSLYLFWRHIEAHPGNRPAALAFIAVSAASFYAKGLVGPGLIWIPVSAYLLYRRDFRKMFLLSAAFAAAFAAFLAPWGFSLFRSGGTAYLHGVFFENQFGRFFSFSDPNLPLDPYFVHKESFFYYMYTLPLRLLPWTLLVALAIVSMFRSPFWRNQKKSFIVFCIAGMLALLHVSSAKAACYTLPVFPFLFFATGIWLEDSLYEWRSGPNHYAILLTFASIGTLITLLPLAYIVAFVSGCRHIQAIGALPSRAGALISLASLVLVFYALRKTGKEFSSNGPQKAILHAIAAIISISILIGASFVSPLEYHRTYVPLADFIRGEIKSGRRIAMAGAKERDLGAVMFYLDSRMDSLSLEKTEELRDFLYGRPGPAGIVLKRRDLKRVLKIFSGRRLRLADIPHSGEKCSQFVLITN